MLYPFAASGEDGGAVSVFVFVDHLDCVLVTFGAHSDVL